MNRSRHDFGLGGEGSGDEPIAIVGAACRLPGAPDLESFWQLLINKIDAISEIPGDRWNKAALFHPERGQRGKAYTFAAGVLGDVSLFDPAFFGISPREALQMDPQQRLLLELAYEAIEDAGVDAAALAGEQVGVFVGGSSWDYMNLYSGDPSTFDAYSMIGVTLSPLANRISYAFDLHGPSFTVDTACSSSLVALHQACEAMRAGQIGTALVGGVGMLLSPHSFIGFCQASMLSPTGRCHAFDARADGYVRAEGGGMVLLKPLGAALAAGDPIRAIIRGTGVNSDGRTPGLSLPNKRAQAALLREIYARFGLDCSDLAYVEAHGTGTPAGDPIEAGALGSVLGADRSTPLPIGSVKTNVGHLEAGSGMAGLLKAMLVAERGVIPASLNSETPNPNIPFAELNLRLAQEAITLPDDGRTRLVGVNSFGFGGTNAHAVLEAPERRAAPTEANGSHRLPPLLISARSEGALRALASAWRDRLEKEADAGDLPALVRGAALRRSQHQRRLTIPAGTAIDMIEAIDAHLEGKPGAGATNNAVSGGIAFVFSGNGSQWAGMAADAFAGSASFRDAIAIVDATLAPWLGWSVAEALLEPDAEALRNTDIAQPLLFAIQVALVMGLRAEGIEPDACMGHSVGEVAAAWAAGALDLAGAARVIAARSRAQQIRHGIGAMAVLGLDAATSAAALATPALALSGVEIAAHNSSRGTTVAGPANGIALLETEAKREGWRFTKLDLDYAFHSAAMDPIEPQLDAELRGLAPIASQRPFFSTVSGGRLDGEALDASYWWRNVREPVLFAEAARAMIDDGIRIFVEIGPHAVLGAYLTDALTSADKEGRVLASLGRRSIKHDPVATIAARAHAAGADIRRADAFVGEAAVRGLPAYPWQRERFWVSRTEEATDAILPPFEHPLLGQRRGGQPLEWGRHIAIELQPWLADHVVGGAAVVPAAALLEMALAAARARHPHAAALDLLDIEIGRALVIEPHMVRETRLRIGSAAGDFELSSRPRLSEEAWVTHMTGRIAEGEQIDIEPVADETPQGRVAAETLYGIAHDMGLDYGPAFRAVEAIDLLGDERALVRFGPAALLEEGLLLPPNLVDGALQGLLALAADRLGTANGVLPWRFGRVRLLAPAGAVPAAARLAITRVGPRSVRADIVLIDAAGTAVATLADCWFVRVVLGRAARGEEQFFHPVMVSSLDPAGEPAALGGDVALALGGTGIDTGEESRLFADAYVAAAAAAALLPLAEDGILHPQALLREGRIAAASRPLLDRLLRWLDADALAEQHADGGWTFATADLPPADAILRTLLFDSPRGIAEAALLALAGDALPAVLRDGPGAYPALPAALWDQVLASSPAGTEAANALADAVIRLAAARPAGRSLRILEVGARRGGFTRLLLRTLRDTAPTIVAATDSDDLPTLAATLEKVAGVRALAWAPGEPLDEMPFDLIVSLHGLSLGGLGGAGLGSLRSLLAPGGMLLAAEPVPNRLWQVLGPDTPPLADGSRWQAQFEAAGFADAGIRPLPTGLWPACLIAGRVGDAAREKPAIARSMTLFADPSPFAEAMAAVLDMNGARVMKQSLDGIGETPPNGGPLVILLDGDDAGLADRLARIARLADLPSTDAPVEVTILTHGTAYADPQAAALMGVRRVLANEAGHVASRLIRLSSDLPLEQAAAHAATELLYPDAEQEIGWDPDGRHVARVRRGLPAVANDTPIALRLSIERPGLLDSLSWTVITPASPGAGELAIKVEAAGLNFRDVMWAMGLLPDEALLDGFAGPSLGLECAGTVTQVGDGVTDFVVGDRVMAFAPASLGTHTVTAAHAVMRMPAGMDFAAAATVPVTFLTVAYSLGHLAQLAEGETVLIHGGAGGVGLAAIQYARHRGARVFATAGSPAKRALLKNLGVEAVLDSRSLAFADDVMRLTNGQGVDVVLNSLSGEAMRRSLALVRPFGRFLELGKRDFYENSSVGLRPFRHNVSYFGIDADQLPLKRPHLAGTLFAEISAMFADGALRPLPHRVYDFADAEDAFRLMQASGHIGKIILAPGTTLPAALPSTPAFTLREDRTYVVTGGLDGFGLETARWLARRGARNIALLSRRGAATPDAAAHLARFAADGVEARAYAVDVADEAVLAETLATIRVSQAPIAGIVHAAVAMDDALLTALDTPRFARALRPKLDGAELLDRLTRHDPIEHFILFSSVTTPLGNPGQGNYVAANAAIEAVAERRHAAGLPALAVQWGPIGDAGYLARETQVSEMLARQLGGAHLSAAEALDTIPILLAAGMPVAGVATVRWTAMKARLPLLASPLFAEIGGAGAEEASELDLGAMLAGCGPEEARTKVTGLLVEEVARIMKLAPDRIEPSRPLTELGMDSLMAVELRLAVEQRFGVTVPLLALSEGATLTAMAGRIVRSLGEPAAPEQGSDSPNLVEWLSRHESIDTTGPATGATAPAGPGFAAAAATSP